MESEKKASLSDESLNDIEKQNTAHYFDKSEGCEKIFDWSIKAINGTPKDIVEGQVLIFLVSTVWILFVTWLAWGRVEVDVSVIVMGYAVLYGYVFFLIRVFRQKTIFNYSVTSKKALLEYYDYYPDFAGPFFQGIAIFTILLFLGVALVTGSLLFLVGPAAISIGAARSLLNWENKIHHRETRPWDTHNFVTIDRKRSIIVI
ncbi:permease, partial [Pseudomonas cichorii]|uniref:permease n=1 Tax=Pseudomonas cichorii TaxID=36746 RepID=UPI0019109CAF